VSVPLVGWSHCNAIRQVTDAHIVTQVRNRDAMLRAGLVEGADFTALNTERVAKPLSWLGYRLCGGEGKGWTTITAFNALSYYDFEYQFWKHFKGDLKAGKYDVVHRVTPLSPTAPSTIAPKLKKIGVPFVVGPLNGGLPWPKGFETVRRKEREWLSYLRSAYKLMPGYKSTRRDASAIVAGSQATYEQLPASIREKLIYVPENSIDPSRFSKHVTGKVQTPLKLAFVGRFVPYKGADMLLRAMAPLIRENKVIIDMIGEGPMRSELESLTCELGIKQGVKMDGWVEHDKLQDRLMQSDVFAFPSVREFGGGVVLEAMAMGLMPIVMQYGGPGELVTEKTGYGIEMGSRDQIIDRLRQTVETVLEEPQQVRVKGALARQRVIEKFTWQAKAKQMLEVYQWVLNQREDKPNFGMPFEDVLLSIAGTQVSTVKASRKFKRKGSRSVA